MKIGIDTFGCNHSKSGMGSYILNFLSNLSEEQIQSDLYLFGLEVDRYTYTSENGLPYISIDIKDNYTSQLKWHNKYINKFSKKNKFDIILFPAIDQMYPMQCKTFKGIAIANSVVFSDSNYKQHKQIKKSLKNIYKIIACSNFIKENLVKNGIDKSKISVIYNGVDHKMFFPMVDLNEDVVELNPFSIKRPYFIYASRLSGPEKKHIPLIKAFNLFKSKTHGEQRLVIAGDDDIYSQTVHQMAFNTDFADEILFTGHFPYASFPKLYAGAQLCVIPSISEGVGLTLIEAMACGIPVICSDQGALKEVGGVAPIYFNADDVDSMVDAMERVVNDKKLRDKMIKDGLEQSGKFNWKQTVKETLDIIYS